MTLNIQVHVPEDMVSAGRASDYLSQALAAIGFSRDGLMASATPSAIAPPPGVQQGVEPAPAAEKPARRTRAKAEPAPAPETPVDDTATEAQDEADEQAEVDAAREPSAPLTTEDVKAAMSEYVKKFGMTATQEDGPKIFVEALGAPPAGQDYWKLSLLADADQATLAKAAATWKKAADLNPLKRAAV